MDIDKFQKDSEKFTLKYALHICLVALTLMTGLLFRLNPDVNRVSYIIILVLAAIAAVAVLRETAYYAVTRNVSGKKYPVLYRLFIIGVWGAGILALELLHRLGYFFGDHSMHARIFQGASAVMTLYTVASRVPRQETSTDNEAKDR